MDTGSPRLTVLIALRVKKEHTDMHIPSVWSHLGSKSVNLKRNVKKNLSPHRDGSGDALLVAPQTFAFLPAHRLQHFVADIITL